MTSTDLKSQLQQWARDREILPQEFRCAHYDDCQASRKNIPPLQRGDTCMMSYIGRRYGDTPYRLAIVGMDHGEHDGGDFHVRSDRIEAASYQQQGAFNQHYRGVIKTAAAVLGEEGRFCRESLVHSRPQT